MGTNFGENELSEFYMLDHEMRCSHFDYSAGFSKNANGHSLDFARQLRHLISGKTQAPIFKTLKMNPK